MEPLDILKKYWGYDAFRPQQAEIIESVIKGKDTLALLPTGGGKSICFQVPALLQEGICIVISPLIALMKDQVDQLQKRNIPAAAIHSGLSYREIDILFDNAVHGALKFLYLSPERLQTEMARERIAQMNVNLVAIDEAHCVSQWGYDFRPPYLEIATLREIIPKVPFLALTATAVPEVVKDIQDKLCFSQENVFQSSFERKNLAYVVLHEENKLVKLAEILRNVKGSAVVYARNRRQTKEVAIDLQRKKIVADFYHAGLDHKERANKQSNWITGKTRVMVATNAFGMGIDKADVRSVVHLDLPDSLEAYFQEAGRAGRDGKKAFAVLLYEEVDKDNLKENYTVSFPSLSQIRQIYRALGSYYQLAVGGGEGQSYDFNIIEFARNYKLDVLTSLNALKILEQDGWLYLSEAVYTPSRARIKVDREALYDFQLRNKKLDGTLKALMRAHTGVFSHLVKISEQKLAGFAKIDPTLFSKQLTLLEKEGIIEYFPQKDSPQLTFLKERVNAEDLTIDQEKYNFRKQRARERMDAVIDYCETPRCRNQMLLQYFGEENAKPCGICDVCLGRTESDISPDDLERLKQKIIYLLRREPLTEIQIIGSFHPNKQEKVFTALTYLLEEGFLIKEEDKVKSKEA
ncbi:MAG: RecQ family ATP-dependent DNA helicase [Saprospiraceae bacterium]|nr:RecQ family ATP-dependent DNA helicase [Saprospiraceae bacterium]